MSKRENRVGRGVEKVADVGFVVFSVVVEVVGGAIVESCQWLSC